MGARKRSAAGSGGGSESKKRHGEEPAAGLHLLPTWLLLHVSSYIVEAEALHVLSNWVSPKRKNKRGAPGKFWNEQLCKM